MQLLPVNAASGHVMKSQLYMFLYKFTSLIQPLKPNVHSKGQIVGFV